MSNYSCRLYAVGISRECIELPSVTSSQYPWAGPSRARGRSQDHGSGHINFTQFIAGDRLLGVLLDLRPMDSLRREELTEEITTFGCFLSFISQCADLHFLPDEPFAILLEGNRAALLEQQHEHDVHEIRLVQLSTREISRVVLVSSELG